MTRKATVLTAIVLVALAAVAATGAVSAAAGPSSTAASAGNQLAGTWQATVNRPAPLPPLRSLQIFSDDGSVIETSNEPPATRSQLYGSWERIQERLYAATGVHFLFNPQTGELVGTRKINRTIELAQDGQSFSVIARVTTYDPSGNVVGSGIATSTGERLQVEPIPDRP